MRLLYWSLSARLSLSYSQNVRHVQGNMLMKLNPSLCFLGDWTQGFQSECEKQNLPVIHVFVRGAVISETSDATAAKPRRSRNPDERPPETCRSHICSFLIRGEEEEERAKAGGGDSARGGNIRGKDGRIGARPRPSLYRRPAGITITRETTRCFHLQAGRQRLLF